MNVRFIHKPLGAAYAAAAAVGNKKEPAVQAVAAPQPVHAVVGGGTVGLGPPRHGRTEDCPASRHLLKSIKRKVAAVNGVCMTKS